MSIGYNIKEKRTQKGLSQEVLAEMLHISQAKLSNIESNKSIPDIRLLQQIANELDTTLNELIKEKKVIFNNANRQEIIGCSEVVNNLSDKLIELYEKLLSEKNTQIEEFKRILQKKK